MYVINLDNKKSKGTNWVSSFIDRHAAVYFDSFGTEYTPQKVINKIKDTWKTLLDYTNLLSPNDYKTIKRITNT